MSALKGLTFVAYTRPDKLSVEAQRRNKLITHLREQMSMAEAEADGKSYTVKKRKWVKTQEGGKALVEADKRLKPWWQTQNDGTVLVTVRYGARPLEFEKGKAAIVLNSMADLPSLFPKLIQAVDAGEFDGLIAATTKIRPVKRKAA